MQVSAAFRTHIGLWRTTGYVRSSGPSVERVVLALAPWRRLAHPSEEPWHNRSQSTFLCLYQLWGLNSTPLAPSSLPSSLRSPCVRCVSKVPLA